MGNSMFRQLLLIIKNILSLTDKPRQGCNVRINKHSHLNVCIRETGHEGPHQAVDGRAWWDDPQ